MEQKQVRIFENETLEKLSKTHPIIPLLFWTPVMLILFTKAWGTLSLLEVFSFCVLGILIWTLVEYLLHRFIFHFEGGGKLTKRIVFMMHDNHHIAPTDWLRGVMPVLPGVLIGLPLYALWNVFFGIEQSLIGMGGMIFGYLCYDYLHYSFHHFNLEWKWWRKIRRNHLKHHVDHNSLYGVSNPFWDYIFSTY